MRRPAAAPLPAPVVAFHRERIRKQLDAVGGRNVWVWGDAALAASLASSARVWFAALRESPTPVPGLAAVAWGCPCACLRGWATELRAAGGLDVVCANGDGDAERLLRILRQTDGVLRAAGVVTWATASAAEAARVVGALGADVRLWCGALHGSVFFVDAEPHGHGPDMGPLTDALAAASLS